MTQKEKLFLKFYKQPESLSYNDICKIFKWCELHEVKGKGSHVLFKKDTETICVIPVHNNECKPFYKRKALQVLLHKKVLISQK